MLGDVPIIDADGHLMDFDDLIRKYLPERLKRKILGENAQRVYGL